MVECGALGVVPAQPLASRTAQINPAAADEDRLIAPECTTRARGIVTPGRERGGLGQCSGMTLDIASCGYGLSV